MKKFIFFLVILVAMTISINAQWQQTNGPLGARVTSFAFSGGNIFAATDGAGVFLSTNNGSSWTAMNNGLNVLFIESLVVSGNNVFASTLEIGGVYLSTNNGVSWTSMNNGIDAQVITLAVSGNNIFAGTRKGVFISSNNG